MNVLGYIRKTATRVVLGQESRLRSVKKDAVIAKQVRSQTDTIFWVRVTERPWNSERTTACPVEVAQYGPMSRVIEKALSEFARQFKNKKSAPEPEIKVEAVLPNLTRIDLPEKFWKKYLPTDR